ncbi:MAG: hypothetical protein WD898_01955, partial [Candidatus Paceibacterota bacterium]
MNFLESDKKETMAVGDKFIAAVDVAQEFDYDPDHIGLLVRRGAVKGIKVGKRWYVSRASLEDYKKRADEQKKVNALKNVGFSLATSLAQEFDYDPDHIGLLVRRGAVKGIKVGKRWYVSRASLEDYKKRADEQKKVNALKNVGTVKEIGLVVEPSRPFGPTVPSSVLSQIADTVKAVGASRVNLSSSVRGALRFVLLALFVFSTSIVSLTTVKNFGSLKNSFWENPDNFFQHYSNLALDELNNINTETEFPTASLLSPFRELYRQVKLSLSPPVID